VKKLFLNTLVLALFSIASFAGEGKISFEKTKLEFDKVQQGNVVKAEFKFTNTGDGILVINKVKPG